MRKILLAACSFSALGCLAADAQTGAAKIPDFAGNWGRTWTIAGTYDAPPAGFSPGPVMADPLRPHHGHTDTEEATPWIAAWDNPILKPETKAIVKKISDDEDKGIGHTEAQTNCRPMGVPEVANLRGSVQILQTPTEVTILYNRDNQIRHIFLNQKEHSKNLTPSYYGESIGRYEGNTLVIDTIGTNDKQESDRFGSPHSTQSHTVERYTISADGRTIQGLLWVDDPVWFTQPWYAQANYRRGGDAVPGEDICAENNRDVTGALYPIPIDEQADF